MVSDFGRIKIAGGSAELMERLVGFEVEVRKVMMVLGSRGGIGRARREVTLFAWIRDSECKMPVT